MWQLVLGQCPCSGGGSGSGGGNVAVLVALMFGAWLAVRWGWSKWRKEGPVGMGKVIKVAIVLALVAVVAVTVMMKKGKSSATGTPAAVTMPATGLPRLVDLGSTSCIPCKMMAPVLEELKKAYAGRLQVEVIDVNATPEAAEPYHIQLIPTQVFFDAAGQERFRHQGFISKEDILAKWQALGVDLKGDSK
jgi:thioredoxin 1